MKISLLFVFLSSSLCIFLTKDRVCKKRFFHEDNEIADGIYLNTENLKEPEIYISQYVSNFFFYQDKIFSYDVNCYLFHQEKRFIGGLFDMDLTNLNNLKRYNRYFMNEKVNALFKGGTCPYFNMKSKGLSFKKSKNLVEYKDNRGTGKSVLIVWLPNNKEIINLFDGMEISSKNPVQGNSPLAKDQCFRMGEVEKQPYSELGIDFYTLGYVRALNIKVKNLVFEHIEQGEFDAKELFEWYMKIWDYAILLMEHNIATPILGAFFVIDENEKIYALYTKRTAIKHLNIPMLFIFLRRVFDRYLDRETRNYSGKLGLFIGKFQRYLENIHVEKYMNVFEKMFNSIVKKFIFKLEDSMPHEALKQFQKAMNRMKSQLERSSTITYLKSLTAEQSVGKAIQENFDYQKRLEVRERIRKRLNGSWIVRVSVILLISLTV